MFKSAGSVERLANRLARMPGVGRKSAARLAFHILKLSKEEAYELADIIREKLKSTVGVLAGIVDGKVVFVATVTDDLIKSKGIKAGEVVKQISKAVGGTGGGKPHLAQGGGKDLKKLDQALDSLPEIVRGMIK